MRFGEVAETVGVRGRLGPRRRPLRGTVGGDEEGKWGCFGTLKGGVGEIEPRGVIE